LQRLQFEKNNEEKNKKIRRILRNLRFKFDNSLYKGYFTNANSGRRLHWWQRIERKADPLPSVVVALVGSRNSSFRIECGRTGICSFIIKDTNLPLQLGHYFVLCNENGKSGQQFFIKLLLRLIHFSSCDNTHPFSSYSPVRKKNYNE
jgi:hypothetical protein